MQSQHYSDSISKYCSDLDKANFVLYPDEPPNPALEALYKKKNAEIEKTMKQHEAAFKARLIGYTVMHSFRAKNKLGAIILDSLKFNVDTNLTVTEPAPAEAI